VLCLVKEESEKLLKKYLYKSGYFLYTEAPRGAPGNNNREEIWSLGGSAP
jgi:hypothetical protein